jgi:hypothetical protein
MQNAISFSFRVCLFSCIFCVAVLAQTLAPGAPGNDAYWATAAKQGIGTSATLESKVWFTLAQGVMTEVYYPDVTTANVHLLQFVVVDPKTKKVYLPAAEYTETPATEPGKRPTRTMKPDSFVLLVLAK